MQILKPLGRSVAASPWLSLFALAATVVWPAAECSAQTTSELLDPWTTKGFGETVDRFSYQAQADVDGSSATTQIFAWDSVGRFQLAPDSVLKPHLGYRYLTLNFDSNAATLPDTLDELSLAAGVSLGSLGGGKLSAIAGIGYSGDNLFADADGLFGIGHLLWERQLNKTDTLVLSLDYDRSGTLLPDVPLPGFAYRHADSVLSWTVGFPRSELLVNVTPGLSLSASYAAPMTADVTLEQQLGDGLSVFGGYSNFYNGFFLDGESREDRFFLQMQRVEVGVRYINGDMLGKGLYLDAGLSVGYVLDQSWSRGFDVRDLENIGSTEATPFVGLVIRGRF